MKKTDCDQCKHGSRHNALDSEGRAILKSWAGSEVSTVLNSERYWTYFVCAKNTFSITLPCGKFVKR